MDNYFNFLYQLYKDRIEAEEFSLWVGDVKHLNQMFRVTISEEYDDALYTLVQFKDSEKEYYILSFKETHIVQALCMAMKIFKKLKLCKHCKRLIFNEELNLSNIDTWSQMDTCPNCMLNALVSDNEAVECVICKEECQNGFMFCCDSRHQIHFDCIQTLTKCPQCRRRIMRYESSFLD